MKNSLLLLIIITLIGLSRYEITYSNENEGGKEFYLVVFPGQVVTGDTVAEVFVHSKFDTDVFVYIKNFQLVRTFKTKANDFISFSLTSDEIQASTNYSDQPKEGVFENSAIKIIVVGDDSATCFVRTKYGNMSDGTALIDKNKAGITHFVSNPEKSLFIENTPANYTAIVGLHDDTRITFRMGGCESCKAMREDGSMISLNQTIRRSINERDVYYVPAYNSNSVLTGSIVFASKPVLVFSGSNKAIGKDGGYNYTITQEAPVASWGKSYLLPQLFGTPHFPLVSVFTQTHNTPIVMNGIQLSNSDKIDFWNGGYYQAIAKDIFNPEISTVEVSSDSIINVVMIDPKIIHKNKSVLPFQMQIMPTENFSKTAVVKIIDNQTDFVNIIYKATMEGYSPDHLQIAELIDGKLNWVKLSNFAPDIDLRYIKTLKDSSHYRTKNIKFVKAGTYHFKSDQPFGVYQYGYSETGAYGFPVNVNLYPTHITDSLPPAVVCGVCRYNGINGTVIDEPRNDPKNRSNLAVIYMQKENSINFNFSSSYFIPGIDSEIKWYLNSNDVRLDSRAHLIFMDRNGNRTDTIIKCPSLFPKITNFDNNIDTFSLNKDAINQKITAEISRFSDLNISNNFELFLILDSDSTEQKVGDINNYQNFDIVGLRDVNLFPLLDNNQIINAEISFNSAKMGKFKDSLGFVIIQKEPFKLIHWEYVEELSALIGDNYITAEDYEFDTTGITFSKETKLKISNPNSGNSETSLDLKIHNIKFVGQNIGFTGSGKTFEVSLPQDITEENPLIIKPNEFYEYDVKFAPQEEMDYNVAIVFEADADKPKNTSIIKGNGLSTSVSEEQKLSSDIEIHSDNGTLKFFSEENYFLDEIEIYDLSGKLLSKFKVEKELNGYSIETSILTKGVYIVNCRVNGLWFSKKVIY